MELAVVVERADDTRGKVQKTRETSLLRSVHGARDSPISSALSQRRAYLPHEPRTAQPSRSNGPALATLTVPPPPTRPKRARCYALGPQVQPNEATSFASCRPVPMVNWLTSTRAGPAGAAVARHAAAGASEPKFSATPPRHTP